MNRVYNWSEEKSWSEFLLHREESISKLVESNQIWIVIDFTSNGILVGVRSIGRV